MPAIALETPRQSRSVLKLSLGFSLAAVGAMLTAILLVGAPAYAGSTFNLTGSCAPPCNWSSPSNWTGGPVGTYPGQVSGDTASLCSFGANVTVDVAVPQGVILGMGCTGVGLTINGTPATNSLQIEASSLVGSGGNTITVNGGNLSLNGTINNSAAAITLNSGTVQNLSSANYTSAQTFTVNGATATFTNNGTFNVSAGGTLAFSAGTITNNFNLNLLPNPSVGPGATFNWSGGTLDGSGTTSIQSGPTPAVLNVSGPVTFNGIGSLNNAGSFSLSGSSISTTSGTPVINNSGTLTQSAATATISPTLNNSGTVSLPSTGQTLILSGGGTHTGTFLFGSGGSGIGFDGTHTFNSPWTWNAASGAIFHLRSGTSTFNAATPVTISNFIQDGGSTLTGPQLLKISNSWTWNGGTQSSAATTELLAGATATAASGSVTLDTGRILQLDSGSFFNYGPTAGNGLAINNGAKITNSGGGFSLLGDNDITTNSPATSMINNTAFALVKKTGGVLTTIQPQFNSATSNTVSVQSGRIALVGGGTISNSTLDLSTIGTSLEFGGLGIFNVDPATTTVTGTTSSSLLLTGSAMLKLTPSGVLWPINVTFVQDNASVLQSPGGIGLNGIYNFNGGTMDGSGAGVRNMTVNASGVLNFAGTNPTAIINAWVIQNNGGTINYNPGTGGGLSITTNSSLQNSLGSFNIQNSNGIGITGDTTGTLTNLGAITKSGGGLTRIDVDVFMSAGTITTTAGTLVFNGAGLSQGISSNITAGAGTTVEFRNGSIGWSGTFGGPGTYLISTGKVVFGGSFTSPPVVTQTGGDLFAASGTFTVGTGSVYNWLGGTIGGTGAGGSMTINGGTLNINTATTAVLLENFQLNVGLGLTSTATWTGGNPITLQNNAPIGMSTGGTFDIQASSSVNLGACAGCNAGFFVNGASTLKKSSAPLVTINVPVTLNGGTLNVLNGPLALNPPSIITSNGTFDIAAGAVLGFPGGDYQIVSPSTFNAPGTLKINGGTLLVSVSPAPSIANIDFQSGSFGIGNVSTTNSFLWNGGTLSGSALTVAGGTATLNGANGVMNLSAFLITNSGTTTTYNSTTNPLNVNYPGGSISNGGTFTLATTQPITLTGVPPAGTYLFMNNTGATLNGNGTINVGVTNDGNLNPGTSPGMITINNAYAQTANGVYNVDLNGTTPATQYDQLNVNGAVTLAGTLNAFLGYTPANGDAFNVLTFTSRTGDFTTKNLPTFGAGGTIQASYIAGPPQALQLLAVAPQADVFVTQTATPSPILQGQSTTFSVVVGNNGPSPAGTITVTNTFTGGTFVSVTSTAGATCSGTGPITCTIASLNMGATQTISITLKGTSVGTITNTASAVSANDSVPGNNSATTSVAVNSGCPSAAPTSTLPGDGVTNVPLNGTLSWNNVGAASYTVFFDVQGPNACNTFLFTTTGTSLPYGGLLPGTTYQWRIEADSPGCPAKTTSCLSFTTASSCPITAPVPVSPVNTTVTNSATFTWTAVQGASDYLLFINGQQVAKVTSTSFGPTPVPNGAVSWYVIAEFPAPCGPLQSQSATFNGCNLSATTIPSIVGQADSGQGYDLTWDAVSGASRYEVDETDKVDEAGNPNFTNPTMQSTTNTKLHFQHPVTTPTAFYYRVRAFFDCANAFGAYSVTVRIVLSPVTSPVNPNVSAPAGNTTLIPITVHVPGFPNGTFSFTASLDPQEPWLVSVTPSSGSLPPAGLDFIVMADPNGLPPGTHSGTLLLSVTTSSSKGGLAPNGVTPVAAPVSISLVTPVTPKAAGTPAANSLIIPSTGHLDGVNSRWASDVRILNTSTQSIHYQLTFTPDDTTQPQKQTVIQINSNTTTALDDVIKSWYGVGSLGESSNGSLEIRPLDNPAKTGADDVSVSFVTVATSRTYNTVSSASTASYGEFVPAIPFGSFVGRALDSAHAATVLGLQQIAQSDSMRTNLGVMEASGQPASILISVFDGSGNKLLDVPMSLAGGQHAQLNGFLSQNKISLPDGRIEVQVTGGEGKIAAYASVIDNKSGDPILVSGTPLRQSSFDTFVLPGVADLNTPVAAWRTDMRIFNPTSTPQFTTLTFYPLTGQGSPQVTSMTVNAGEVKRLDNTLASVFGVTNAGGTIHVTTGQPQPLVVTGRTYDLTSNGTFGQLASAVTSADAIGQGDRPLQILQAEDSVRERTNVGLFEVTGKPATVQVTLFVPDSKISPSTQITLPGNGFVQIPIISSFGMSNVYNARISMSVVGGDGKISGYGSVIDQVTQAPTYIPVQH